jgi:hypothetical protein
MEIMMAPGTRRTLNKKRRRRGLRRGEDAYERVCSGLQAREGKAAAVVKPRRLTNRRFELERLAQIMAGKL